jgi:hypothetical protein
MLGRRDKSDVELFERTWFRAQTQPVWRVGAVVETICPYKRQRGQNFDVQAKWKPFGG